MKPTILLLLFLCVSCSSEEDESSTKIVNGVDAIRDVNGVEVDEHPAVVKILGNDSFTGTFISHNILLTAAHNVLGVDEVYYKGQFSDKIIYQKKYETKLDWEYDIAVIKFKDKTATHFLNISEIPIAVGDELTLVGFGYDDYSTETKGPSDIATRGMKRQGTNKFYPVRNSKPGAIMFEGEYGLAGETDSFNKGKYRTEAVGTGEDASIGQGDSGGPLIVGGKGIVGVASYQYISYTGKSKSGPNYKNVSVYTDLHSTESQKFLKKAISNFEKNGK